ncbi:threonylcarbamoyl-AMP synthase [Pseudoalteromonas sp. GCY]|uniref:L-threonylcarbamoyladenylate synthase n=1 Tax=Pseudoalteromonas sp. GCY TaxID=2003316 RepID=UPI000BFEBE6C|nr:L-threonylcarbamoyladenylate synthase [Pseudoalteromonas sp. GCY]PHI35193.1 threonylcarbamoyl-AMP synthase [Pseudoalteromonas sp. GCY]QQQ68892.1 threonylcarbamoyl-AMP synthase [Pseudoalteromonas sp. GCY]
MGEASLTTLHLLATDPSAVAQAAELARDGHLVAVPTETVYGLAADARQPDAVKKIFAAKGRPADHPLIVHLADKSLVTEWVETLPDYFDALADTFWPGPLTIVAKKQAHVSDVVTGGHPTVGIRVPNHPAMLALLQHINSGLAAPSANPYKKISPTTAEQVLFGLSGKIAAVLDGGPCEVGLESTIVDISSATPRILRAGPITKAALEAVLNIEVDEPDVHTVAVPGNVKAHYQPSKPLTLLSTEELVARLSGQCEANTGVLYYSSQIERMISENSANNELVDLKLGADKAKYAHGLYHGLHQLDQSSATEILLEAPPTAPEWRDVNDRLMRAAAQ